MSRIRDIASILTASTAMATDAEVTSSIASHAAAADPHTVYLKSATAASTYAALSNPTFTAVGGSEGGQINLGAATTNNTLTGPISLDVYENRVRLFEGGGNNRGAYVDLTTLSNAVGSELLAASPQSGNSGKYLTTNGTNASWASISAGGMTLLSTTSLSGTTTTISSISGSYKHLFFLIRGIGASANSLAFRTNGITTTNYYCNTRTIGNGFAFSAAWSNGASEAQFNGNISTNSNNAAYGWMYDYSNTTVSFKPCVATLYNDGNDKWMELNWVNRGLGTSAINSITVYSPTSGTLSGTLLLYGVN